MGKLEGQAAVITGGGNGIGRETVLRFLREGARVVVADLNPENGARTLELAAGEGHRDEVRFVRTDVTAEAEVRAAIECARDEFGRLDCVFNNAGIGGAFGPVTETQVEEWDFSMEVLVRGVFLGLKHGARVLKRQGQGGALLSTASVAGLGGGAGSHCYSAAKAAVANLTRSVALEMAPHRVRVNAIAPGMIMTELFHRGRSDRGEQFALGRQPWPDPGRPADIAAAAAFLASPDAVFITGQVLVVDGGILAKGPDIFGSGEENRMLRAAGVDRGTTGEPLTVRDVSGPGT
ncbi:MAG: glucose 1-dehydrogenase [Immundisolibacterales bacterium]|nr:glucose 1-dehydrogenase [Immundisolibacterales bacterium]